MTGKRFNFVKNENCVEDTLTSICYDVDSYRFDPKLVELLNELYEENQELRGMEFEDRDIVCGAGKFRLEEWGKHRYHQFYKDDEELEDETVVIMLMELEKENKELKNKNEQLRDRINDWHQRTFKAHEYFNILEKVIDEVCDGDISNQIWKEYEKRERLIE